MYKTKRRKKDRSRDSWGLGDRMKGIRKRQRGERQMLYGRQIQLAELY